MRAQGQTGVVELSSSSSSSSMGKSSRIGKVSKQRARRCSGALEPVLEHCELSLAADDPTDGSSCKITILGRSRPKPLRSMLSKVLAVYVKLMNDVASGADVGGVSSFYGASSRTGYFSHPCISTMTGTARVVVVKETTTEKEQQLLHRIASPLASPFPIPVASQSQPQRRGLSTSEVVVEKWTLCLGSTPK